MYKKVAPLNLPLPFVWALSPFFPSGHLTPSPGKETCWREALVLRCLPCSQESPEGLRFQRVSVLPRGRAVFVLQEPVSAAWATFQVRGAGVEAPARARTAASGRLASAPPCCFLLAAAQQCPQG